MASKRPSGLGKGLGALLGDDVLKAESTGSLYLPISQVESCSSQPRKHFDEASLAELADSIREHGIIQPLTVRKLASGYYQIIAGERRWRAARLAGLQEVPVIVMEADDRKAAELAMIENLQREDLNPIEEAAGFQSLMETYHMTQEEAASRVGKSRSAVANALRLLSLTPPVAKLVEEGKLEESGKLADQMEALNRDIQSVERLLDAARQNAQPLDGQGEYDGVLHGEMPDNSGKSKENSFTPSSSLGAQLKAIYSFRKGGVRDERLEKINAAAESAGRSGSELRLLAATKMNGPEAVQEAIRAGVDICAENRVQEFLDKRESYSPAEVHFIGGLQTNKVKYIIDKVSMIHSVDSVHLAEEISRRAGQHGLDMDILAEINIGGEETKGGITPESAAEFCAQIGELPHIRLRGLMTIPPPGCGEDTFEAMQRLFGDLRADKAVNRNGSFDTLSMGMSGDYETAVKHGSTIVRIGSGLFGYRKYL